MEQLVVAQALEAARAYSRFDQAKVDAIVRCVCEALEEHLMRLSQLAVEETGIGNPLDKLTKNRFATQRVYEHIKDKKTVGVIGASPQGGAVEIAEPVGIIAALVPVTNPTSTTLFKSLLALKTRNPIIFCFSSRAARCSLEAARLVMEAAIAAGAPAGCIGWLSDPGRSATESLMKHPKISLILATGGPSLVRAAYSSGKPAIGVGAGNVPCYVHNTASIKQTVSDLFLSKTFDHGVSCGSEQTLVVDRAIAPGLFDEMALHGAYFTNQQEEQRLLALLWDAKAQGISPLIVGRSASFLAHQAGIEVPEGTRLLMVPLRGIGPGFPASYEKLCPVLSYHVEAKDPLWTCNEVLEFGGLGHTAVIHANEERVIAEFGLKMRACRILVNTPSSQGASGGLFNAAAPSLTLGCGVLGGNSSGDNIGIEHLITKKRVWLRLPSSAEERERSRDPAA